MIRGLTTSVATAVWNVSSAARQAGRFPLRVAALTQRHLNVFGLRREETGISGPQRTIGQKSFGDALAIISDQFARAPLAVQIKTWTVIGAERSCICTCKCGSI